MKKVYLVLKLRPYEYSAGVEHCELFSTLEDAHKKIKEIGGSPSDLSIHELIIDGGKGVELPT